MSLLRSLSVVTSVWVRCCCSRAARSHGPQSAGNHRTSTPGPGRRDCCGGTTRYAVDAVVVEAAAQQLDSGQVAASRLTATTPSG